METQQYNISAGVGGKSGCNTITGGDVGGDTGVPIGRGIQDEHDVPRFLCKLYKMVDDKAIDSIISWGSSCISFVISDQQRFITEILPCYFKTSRFDNFSCQLYNYGFKKKVWNRLEFEHEHFREGKQHLLKNIKGRNQQTKAINNTPTPNIATIEIEAILANVRDTQKQIKNKTLRIKDDIEKSLSEVQSIIKDKTHKFISTFSHGVGQKRKHENFVDNEKDIEFMYDQVEVFHYDINGFVILSDLTDKIANGHRNRGGDGRNVPQFLLKLYDMVEKKEIDSFVSWNLPYRDSFIIWDINKFETHVLPMYFNHSNFSSFVTQLNIYGFRKVSWERYEYANERFREGRHDLLANITRRDKNLQLSRSTIKFCTIEVEMFKSRLKTIQQEQENKLICLSNYVEQMKSSMHEFKETIVNMANFVNTMILKRNENHENFKKAKFDAEDIVIDDLIGNVKGQELDVDESGDNHKASDDRRNVHVQAYFEVQDMDLKAMEIFLETEDVWIVRRELEQYFSLCRENPSNTNRVVTSCDTSCS